MAKPFDISKFRKSLTKNITGISTGFNDPDTWISTGSYGLNYLISGDFYRGVPMGKVTVFAGDSGAGKSYIVSGNITRAAQEQDIFVVMVDAVGLVAISPAHGSGGRRPRQHFRQRADGRERQLFRFNLYAGL